jgi:hypothetical protein
LSGVLFAVTVAATDTLGLYAFDFSLVNPASVTFFECPIGGGLCNGATVNYSVNVVAQTVPEPATLTLFGLTLGGLAVARRRRDV